MFANRVLTKIFGPNRDEVTGEWRRLHNEELNYLYFSSNFIPMIKSKRKRWTGMWHVWGTGAYRVLVTRPGRKRYDMIYLLTAIGLSPGCSTHLHTNNT